MHRLLVCLRPTHFSRSNCKMKQAHQEVHASAIVQADSSSCSSCLTCEDDDAPCCWLCLDSEHQPNNPLCKQCACPSRYSHRQCLSRWQLQQAGKVEENSCRFCRASLPPWEAAYAHLPKAAQPVMTISVQGSKHVIPVKQGPEGAEAFRGAIRRLYGLQDDDAVDISFSCCVPGSPETLTLYSWDAFDSAVLCASYANARQQQGGDSESASGLGAGAPGAPARGSEGGSESEGESGTMLYRLRSMLFR